MVFYFTATGNSLYVAKALDTERISIPQIVKNPNPVFHADKIGIVCPVYGHEMPEMVKVFIHKATFYTDYLYIVLTYGNIHGNAVELADAVLKSAGKSAAYINTILMVDNFLPAFDMQAQSRCDKNVEQQLARIKADIQSKKREKQKVTLKDRAAHKMYLRYVKNAPAAVWANFKVTRECIGCGICTRVCPAGCIHLEKQKAIYEQGNCQACMACIHACPQLAIKMNIPEKNASARYRNVHISLTELVAANHHTES